VVAKQALTSKLGLSVMAADLMAQMQAAWELSIHSLNE